MSIVSVARSITFQISISLVSIGTRVEPPDIYCLTDSESEVPTFIETDDKSQKILSHDNRSTSV